MNLFRLINKFVKIAEDLEAPETQRSKQDHPKEDFYFEEDGNEDLKLQAYEFVQFLDRLAALKNTLHRLSPVHLAFKVMFDKMFPLRPGTIKNAIKGMLVNDRFDPVDYRVFRDSTFSKLKELNFLEKIKNLSRLIEIMILDNDQSSSPNKDPKKVELVERLQHSFTLIRLIRPILVNGLSYSD